MLIKDLIGVHFLFAFILYWAGKIDRINGIIVGEIKRSNPGGGVYEKNN